MKWSVGQWIDHCKPYIDEMTEHTENSINGVVTRRLGIQVIHLKDPVFVEAWMTMKQPFTKMMSKHFNFAMIPVLKNFDGIGYTKEVASEQREMKKSALTTGRIYRVWHTRYQRIKSEKTSILYTCVNK